MWAWCDFYGNGAVMPDEARQPWQSLGACACCRCLLLFESEETTCNDQEGCYGGTGWCHCEGKEGCLAVGGYWFAQTCTMEVEMFRQNRQRAGGVFCILRVRHLSLRRLRQSRTARDVAPGRLQRQLPGPGGGRPRGVAV